VHELLGTAYADGRLDRDEFDARADQVGASRTLADLPPSVTDLVTTSSAPSLPRPAQLREEAERTAAFWLPTGLDHAIELRTGAAPPGG
jgi:hypothetical protein